MSGELLGVALGGAIGILGSYLIARLERDADKETRREERRWHYRRETIQRLRPSWDQLCASLYELLDMAEDVLIWLDKAAAIEDMEQAEEFKRQFDRQVPTMHEQADKLKARLSEIPAQIWTVLTMHDPELGPTVGSQIGEALQSVSSVVKVLESLRYDPRPDGRLSPAQIAEAKNQFNECRRGLVRNIRQIETSIERYITDV